MTLAAVFNVQVLGDTLDKIAWEKGGIFKEGCRAMAVEQPRGGMPVLREASETKQYPTALIVGELVSHLPPRAGARCHSLIACMFTFVLNSFRNLERNPTSDITAPTSGLSAPEQCAATAGCGELEVVKPLPDRDPLGRTYEIGLAGEHQRINAGLALRLCAVWMEAREMQRQQQQQPPQVPPFPGGTGDTEAFRGSEEVHRGLSECVWPGRCQVKRVEVFVFCFPAASDA